MSDIGCLEQCGILVCNGRIMPMLGYKSSPSCFDADPEAILLRTFNSQFSFWDGVSAKFGSGRAQERLALQTAQKEQCTR